jgi:hypothetical protein
MVQANGDAASGHVPPPVLPAVEGGATCDGPGMSAEEERRALVEHALLSLEVELAQRGELLADLGAMRLRCWDGLGGQRTHDELHTATKIAQQGVPLRCQGATSRSDHRADARRQRRIQRTCTLKPLECEWSSSTGDSTACSNNSMDAVKHPTRVSSSISLVDIQLVGCMLLRLSAVRARLAGAPDGYGPTGLSEGELDELVAQVAAHAEERNADLTVIRRRKVGRCRHWHTKAAPPVCQRAAALPPSPTRLTASA